MADSPNLRALARQLADMRRRQDRQEQASNSEQLKYSSLDDGSVVEKDASGSIVSRWGKQHDGTHGTAILNGPVPPVPTAPAVDGTAGALTVTWDGQFPDDRRVPLDFQTVQIGVGQPDGDLSMVGVITSEAGGSKTLSIDPGDYDVALRSRAASGRMSAWSSPARATVEPVVDPEVIARLEGAFTTSPEAPTPADGEDKPEGAYWTQIDAEGAQIARWRWVDGAWVDAPIAVEFIPEAYIDFLAANEAFITELGASVALIETLLAHELSVSGRLALEDGAQLHATQPNYGLTLGATGLTMTARVDVGLEHRWTGSGGRTLHGGLTSGGLLQLVSGGPGGAGQGGPGAWGPLTLDDSTTDAHPTHLVTLPGEAQQQVMSIGATSGARSVGSGFLFDPRLWRISLSGHPDPQRQAPWDTTGPGGYAIEDAGSGIEVWSLPDERQGTAALARTIPYGQARATPTWLALDGTTAIEGHGATVRMWDVTTGQQVSAHTVSEPITQVSRVDGVAMVSYGHHVTGIDIETRSEVFSWDLGDILQTGDTLRQFAMVDGTYYASLETNTGGAFVELNTGSGASVVRASMSTATGSVAFNDARMGGETTTERLVVPGVLTADIQRGVQVGVGTPVLEHPAPAEYPDDGAHFTPISEQMAVEPGATYIARLRLERSSDFPQDAYVSLVASWNEDNHVQIANLENLPLYGDGEVRDFSIVPPPTTGMWDTVRLQLNRTPGHPGRVRVSDLQILERARGDVSVDGQVDAQVGTFDRLQISEINTGVMRLDSVHMEGNLRDTGSRLTIPDHLQGTFRKYEMQITGGTTTLNNGTRPLCIYVNSDKGSNWRGSASAWNGDGSHRAGVSYNASSLPLSAYVGQWESTVSLWFYPSGLGHVAVVNWDASGWGNDGAAGGFNWRAGGRWLPGGLQPINHFLIDTNNTGVTWTVTGRATLWGHR